VYVCHVCTQKVSAPSGIPPAKSPFEVWEMRKRTRKTRLAFYSSVPLLPPSFFSFKFFVLRIFSSSVLLLLQDPTDSSEWVVYYLSDNISMVYATVQRIAYCKEYTVNG